MDLRKNKTIEDFSETTYKRFLEYEEKRKKKLAKLRLQAVIYYKYRQ